MEEHKALFEPLWQEGMLLLPQHMQFLSRHSQAVAWRLVGAVQPFAWGVCRLELDSAALEGYQLVLSRCEVVLPSGQIGLMPGNMRVPSRHFKGRLPQDGGSLQVYLGVRELKEGVGNISRDGQEAGARYRLRSLDMYDLNTGEQARKVEVGELVGRVVFEGEEAAGYELVPIARIRQVGSGTGAELEPGYVPPLVWVGGWEPFRRMLGGLAGRIKAAAQTLMEVVGTKEVGEVLATGAGLEAVVKMTALGGVGEVLEQMVGMGRVHPVWVYLELVRLWGRLRAFGGQELGDVGAYDHMDIGGVFGRVVEGLEQVIEGMGARGYQRRAFVLRGGRLEVELEPEWVSGRRELYLGVSGAGDGQAVAQVAGGWKLVAPGQLNAVLQRRLGGLELKWLARAPVGLPAKPDGAYARLTTGGPLWSGVQQELVLVLSGAESSGWRFDLYVV